MPDITEDERAKRVIDGSGTEIGIMDEVEDGTASVDPDPDIDSQLKSKLGWGTDERRTYPSGPTPSTRSPTTTSASGRTTEPSSGSIRALVALGPDREPVARRGRPHRRRSSSLRR